MSSRPAGPVRLSDLERLTTPTRRVRRNPDGTVTMEASAAPVRVKRHGQWVEFDKTLVRDRDGRIGAKVGWTEVSVAAMTRGRSGLGPARGKSVALRSVGQADASDAPLVSVQTPSGELGLTHPSVRSVDGEINGQQVVFADALSHGRDLIEAILPAGVEESVVLPDAAAPNAYEVVLSLPAGTHATSDPRGIVVVDDHDKVVATYGNGVAYDSTSPSSTQWRAEAPVELELIDQDADSARIRVSVASDWLADPGLVFPVTIDPSIAVNTLDTANSGDTWIGTTCPGCNYWSETYLNAGVSWYYNFYYFRSYLLFPVFFDARNDVLPGGGVLQMYQSGGTCDVTTTFATRLSAWYGPYASWYNPMPTWGPSMSQLFGCPNQMTYMDITPAAQSWMGTPLGYAGANYGLALWSYECGCTPLSIKQFFSGNNWIPPTLNIVYTVQNASYTTTRPTGSTQWNRVEGQASEIPVNIANTGSENWPANGDYELGCHLYKPDNTYVGDCAHTKLDTAINVGQSRTINASVPGLDAGTYTIKWDMYRVSRNWFYGDHGVTPLSESINYISNNPFARGDNPYVEFVGGVNTATGTYFHDTTDVAPTTHGPALAVTRSYNHRDSRNGWFGKGWSSTYEMSATSDANGDYTVAYPDGRFEAYTKRADGTYAPPTGFYATFTKNADGTTRLVDKDQTAYDFASASTNNPGRLTKITDTNGETLTLNYDPGSGELGTVTAQPETRTLTYVWAGSSGHRHVVSVTTDPVSRNGQAAAAPLVWHYTYGGTSGDQLATVCDPRFGVGANPKCESFTYDTNDPPRIIKTRRPLTNTAIELTYTPGSDNRVATTKDGVGNQTGYAYTASGACPNATVKTKTTITDPRGGVTVAQYDAAQHLVCHDNELSQRHIYEYDAVRGFLVKDTDEAGAISTFEYDNNNSDIAQRRGNVTKRVDANGKSWYYSYDAKDHVLTTRDGRSSSGTDDTYKTTYGYDAEGNLTSTQPPTATGAALGATTWSYTDGTSTSASYNGTDIPPKGLVATEQKPGQNPTRYFYDAKGDLRRREDPTGLSTSFEVDALGLATRETKTWTNPDQSTGQAATDTVYDELGQVTVLTEPAVTDPVTNLVHQRKVSTTYDANGNAIDVLEHDNGGSSAPDPDRRTSYDFDAADREFKTTYASDQNPNGGSMTREFDTAGNVVAATDQLGRRFETSYTPTNRPDTVTLKAADANAQPNLAQNLVLKHTTYDSAGRVASEFDAEGRERRFAYDPVGQLLSVTLYAPGGSQVVTLEEHVYDAAGNPTSDKAGNAARVVTTDYYPNNLVKKVTLSGVNRVADIVYDTAGHPTSVKRTIGGAGTTEEIRSAYDPATGLLLNETVENGATDLTTTYGYDTRGLKTAVTDPRGNTTNFTYDTVGRQTQATLPAVAIDGGGSDRPTSVVGFNTFGETAQVKNPNGNITMTTYDALGRRVRIEHPAYTPPGGSALSPTETYSYDLVGNTTSSTDRRGQTTNYAFDMLNRVTTKTDPQVTGAPSRGVTTYAYDKVGNQTSVTDQTSRTTTTVYDTRNRPSSQTAGGYTTTYGYDNLDNQTSIQPPGLAATTAAFNAASEQTSITKPGAPATTIIYDLAGRPLIVTDPLGRTTTNTYDLAGRRTRTVQTGGTDTATTNYGYDPSGNQTSVTSPNGATTTLAYDAANRLTGVTQPVAVGQNISTSYGYDRAGNTTRLTDGNGNTTTATYNPWNLPETRSEPNTPGQADAASRDYVTVYDAAGLPLEDRQPGGVTVARTFDELGRVTQESGSGPGTPSASRTFGYDLAGRRTSASHPAGTMTFSYDGRGLLTTTSGGAGTSTYGYDGAGRVTSRQDQAGTATFTWNARNDLTTATDPLTNVTRTNTWDNADQLTQVTYGTTAPIPTRTLTYDGLGRLKSDTLNVNSVNQYSTSYTYDADSNVKTQTIAPASVAGAGTNTYNYDQADRLTSWTKPDTTNISYEYDGAGNRTRAGGTTFSYDARNRLTAASDNRSWTWTPRGTLASATTPQGTTNFTHDALGRLTQQGTTTYTYDSLDRVATRNTTPFTYAGTELDPTSDGTWTYARSPSGDLLALDDTTTPTVPAELAGRNRHGDLTDMFTPTGQVTDTMAYDPFGAETADIGALEPTVGYQSDFTDPSTGQTWMGARWYDPAIDTFTARDTTAGQLKTPISLNRYTYANDNPLAYSDPDGFKAQPLQHNTQILAWQKNIQFFSALYKFLVGIATSKGPRSAPSAPIIQVKFMPKTSSFTVYVRPEYVNTVNYIRALTKPTATTVKAAQWVKTVRAPGAGVTKNPNSLTGYSDNNAGHPRFRTAWTPVTNAAEFMKVVNRSAGACTSGLATGKTGRVAQLCKAHLRLAASWSPSLDGVLASIAAGAIVGGGCELLTAGETFGSSTPGCLAAGGFAAGAAAPAATGQSWKEILKGGLIGAALGLVLGTSIARLRGLGAGSATEAEGATIKAGSAGGETAGKEFPHSVRGAALEENPSTCVYCHMETDAPQVDHAIPTSAGWQRDD